MIFRTLVITIILCAFFSCSLQKRRYMDGYSVSFFHRKSASAREMQGVKKFSNRPLEYIMTKEEAVLVKATETNSITIAKDQPLKTRAIIPAHADTIPKPRKRFIMESIPAIGFSAGSATASVFSFFLLIVHGPLGLALTLGVIAILFIIFAACFLVKAYKKMLGSPDLFKGKWLVIFATLCFAISVIPLFFLLLGIFG